MENGVIFRNRSDAGQQLAKQLLKYKPKQPLILALPRGGVPVGFEVAKALEAPLDTLVARKVGAPFNPEFGVGAIAPGDVIIFDDVSLELLHLERFNLDPTIEQERKEMQRRINLYRSGEYSKNYQFETIIIVDDGLAIGVTARAAIESVFKKYPDVKVIFAAPICSRETAGYLTTMVDVICVQAVDNLMAIGYWYQHFPQTSDEEVIELLQKAARSGAK